MGTSNTIMPAILLDEAIEDLTVNKDCLRITAVRHKALSADTLASIERAIEEAEIALLLAIKEAKELLALNRISTNGAN